MSKPALVQPDTKYTKQLTQHQGVGRLHAGVALARVLQAGEKKSQDLPVTPDKAKPGKKSYHCQLDHHKARLDGELQVPLHRPSRINRGLQIALQ